MTQKRKESFIFVLLTVCITAFLAVVGFTGAFGSFSAAKPVNAESGDFRMGGASVKLDPEGSGGSGIRFRVLMADALYGSLFTDGKANAGVTTGVVVIPTDLAGAELTRETENAGDTKVNSLWKESAIDGYMEAYVYLYGIPAKSYGRTISARGYYIADGVTHYTLDTCERDLSTVALSLYNDADTDYDTRDKIKAYVDATLSMSVSANGVITVCNDVDDNFNYFFNTNAEYKVGNAIYAELDGTTKTVTMDNVANLKVNVEDGVSFNPATDAVKGDKKTTLTFGNIAQGKKIKQVSALEIEKVGGYTLEVGLEGLDFSSSYGGTATYVTKVPEYDESGLNTYLHYTAAKSSASLLTFESFKDIFKSGNGYYVEFTVAGDYAMSNGSFFGFLQFNSNKKQTGSGMPISTTGRDNGDGTATFGVKMTAEPDTSYVVLYMVNGNSREVNFYLKSVRVMRLQYGAGQYFAQDDTLNVGKFESTVVEDSVNPVINGQTVEGKLKHAKATNAGDGLCLYNTMNAFSAGVTYSLIIKGYGHIDRDAYLIPRNSAEQQVHALTTKIRNAGIANLTETVKNAVLDRKYTEVAFTFTVSDGAVPYYFLIYDPTASLDFYIYSVSVIAFGDGRTDFAPSSSADTDYADINLQQQRLVTTSTGTNALYYDIINGNEIYTMINRSTGEWSTGSAFAGTMVTMRALSAEVLDSSASYKITFTSTFIADANKLALMQGNDSANSELTRNFTVKEVGEHYGKTVYEYSTVFTPLNTAGTFLKLYNFAQQAGASEPFSLFRVRIENLSATTDGRKSVSDITSEEICSENGYVANLSAERFDSTDARISQIKTQTTGYAEQTDSTWLLYFNMIAGQGVLPFPYFDQAIKAGMTAGDEIAYVLEFTGWLSDAFSTGAHPYALYALQCTAAGSQSSISGSGVQAYCVHLDDNDVGKVKISFAFKPVADFDTLTLWNGGNAMQMAIDSVSIKGYKMETDATLDTSLTKVIFPNVIDVPGYFANAGCAIIIDRGSVAVIDASEKMDSAWFSRYMIEYTLRKYGVKTIDKLVLTHPHNDHIGDMVSLINNFTVKDFYFKWFYDDPATGMTADGYKNGNKDSSVMNADLQTVLAACAEKGVTTHNVAFGEKVALGGNGSTLTFAFNRVTFGERNGAVDENAYSLTCMYAVNGRNVAYFCGDYSDNAEYYRGLGWTEDEIEYGVNAVIKLAQRCDIYVLAHHGDGGAYNGEELVQKLNATFAISCAPHYEKYRFRYERPVAALIERLISCGMPAENILTPYGDGIVFDLEIDGSLVNIVKGGE